MMKRTSWRRPAGALAGAAAAAVLAGCGNVTGTCTPHGLSATVTLTYPQSGAVNRIVFDRVYVTLSTARGSTDRTLRTPGRISLAANNSYTFTAWTGVRARSCTFTGTN